MSPYDNPTSASARFGVELVAWVAGPWAAWAETGSWVVTVIAVGFLVGLPATFNTPGDKNVTGIATPGPARVGIEVLLTFVALVGAWLVWPSWAFALVAVLSVALVAAGLRRYRWLLAGAPAV